MIVVSDTSPLNYLVLIDSIDVLPKLFEEIYVPTRVIEELRQPATPGPVQDWVESSPDWLRIASPATSVTTSIRLDAGETQAIALAMELQADAVLIDERKGCRVAEEYGLKPIGTIAVLEFAAERKFIDLKEKLEVLRSTSFYISEDFIDAALLRDATRRKSE